MADARKFFDDNVNMLGATVEECVEKDAMGYNLNAGLANMAGQLSQIQAQLREISEKLDRQQRGVV